MLLGLLPPVSMPITTLDKALDAARQDVEKQSAFYDAFLNSELFIPTLDDSSPDITPRRSAEGEAFMPYVVEQNGKAYLPVFDSVERLSKWIQRQVDYLSMPAHALIRSIQGDTYFALNIGTDFWKEFSPEEIQWLRSTVEQAQPHSTTVPAGTTVMVGVPAQIPNGLRSELRDSLSRNTEIRRAYIGQVHLVTPGEQPHLVIALEPDESRSIDTVLDNIRLDVGVALRPFIQKGAYIGIAFTGIDRLASDIKEATSPFYSRHEV